jgi:hypothetical protein
MNPFLHKCFKIDEFSTFFCNKEGFVCVINHLFQRNFLILSTGRVEFL